MKDILEKQLEMFKEMHNISNATAPINTVTLFSGLKPSNYFVPNIFIGRDSSSEAFKRHEEMRNKLAWFVEIWVDDLCVWRKSAIGASNDDLQKEYETKLLEEIMLEIFFYGINAAWRQTKDFKQQGL
jgi:hypothetical protein